MTIATGIVASAEYRLRYRAQNFNGWGPYSRISYFIAATRPSKPSAPVYISSSATSITLQFIEPDERGGSPITAFKLYRDTIGTAPNYTLAYEGISSQYTLTVSKD